MQQVSWEYEDYCILFSARASSEGDEWLSFSPARAENRQKLMKRQLKRLCLLRHLLIKYIFMIFATVAVLVHLNEVNSAPAVIQNICVYQNGVAHHK